MNKRFLSAARAALLCAGTVAWPAFAPATAFAQAPTATDAQNLFPNGNFELDADADGAPDGWGAAKGGLTWETEEGNHFGRLKAPAPGKMTMIYRLVPVPAGTGA